MLSNVQANITMQRTHSVPMQFGCPSQHTPPTTPSVAPYQDVEVQEYDRRLFEVQRALQGSSQFVAEQDTIIKSQSRQIIDAVGEKQKKWEEFYQQKKDGWKREREGLTVDRQNADARALRNDRALKQAQENHKQALENVEKHYKEEIKGVKRKADEALESERNKLQKQNQDNNDALLLTIKNSLDQKSCVEQDLAREREQYAADHVKWQDKIDDLQRRIDKIEQEEEQVRNEHTRQLTIKETAYNELKADRDNLDDRLKDLETAHKNLETECAGVKTTCEDLDTKCKNHNEDREAAVKLWEEKHKELKQEKNLRVQAEQKLQPEKKARQLAEQQRTTAERELTDAKTKLETKDVALQKGREAYERQQSEITKLNRDVASLNTTIQERLDDKQAAKKELKKVQADLAACERSMETIASAERAAKQELQEVKKNLDTSQGELRGMRRAAEGYKATLLKLGENMNLAAMLQGLAPDQKWSLPQKLKLWEGGRRRSK